MPFHKDGMMVWLLRKLAAGFLRLSDVHRVGSILPNLCVPSLGRTFFS